MDKNLRQVTDEFNDRLDEAANQIRALAAHIEWIKGDQHQNSTQAARWVTEAVIDNLTEMRLTSLLTLGETVDLARAGQADLAQRCEGGCHL